jgi:hydrogenase maturation protease
MLNNITLIGIGNDFRRDDGLGIAVARELSSRAIPGLKVITETGEGAALIDALRDADRVIIVDAIRKGDVPGTIHRLDVSQIPIPHTYFQSSTHTFGVAEAIEVARELQQLPPTTIVYGIEGEDFTIGHTMSPPVRHSMPELIRKIDEEVSRLSAV